MVASSCRRHDFEFFSLAGSMRRRIRLEIAVVDGDSVDAISSTLERMAQTEASDLRDRDTSAEYKGTGGVGFWKYLVERFLVFQRARRLFPCLGAGGLSGMQLNVNNFLESWHNLLKNGPYM